MKKGKSCTLNGYRNLKCTYGTVDAKNLKSIYLNIQSWVKPKIDNENWDRPVSLFNQKIKSFIFENCNKQIFLDKSIVDLDLRTSGISLKKKSFMSLEITFFCKEPIDFKSPIIKLEMKKIVDLINSDLFRRNNMFSFHLTKTEKLRNLSSI